MIYWFHNVFNNFKSWQKQKRFFSAVIDISLSNIQNNNLCYNISLLVFLLTLSKDGFSKNEPRLMVKHRNVMNIIIKTLIQGWQRTGHNSFVRWIKLFIFFRKGATRGPRKRSRNVFKSGHRRTRARAHHGLVRYIHRCYPYTNGMAHVAARVARLRHRTYKIRICIAYTTYSVCYIVRRADGGDVIIPLKNDTTVGCSYVDNNYYDITS